jgi:hypothetical protein
MVPCTSEKEPLTGKRNSTSILKLNSDFSGKMVHVPLIFPLSCPFAFIDNANKKIRKTVIVRILDVDIGFYSGHKYNLRPSNQQFPTIQ